MRSMKSLEALQRLPQGFMQEALKATPRNQDGGFIGDTFMKTATTTLRKYFPDAPEHLVSIAWRFAIVRDHMFTIDPDHLEMIVRQLIADQQVVDQLNKPEVAALLESQDGKDAFIKRMVEYFNR